jgi:hypothetical protein
MFQAFKLSFDSYFDIYFGLGIVLGKCSKNWAIFSQSYETCIYQIRVAVQNKLNLLQNIMLCITSTLQKIKFNQKKIIQMIIKGPA